ncbi:primosomal protein N' [Candidatus Saccharibacteria bacterium]|nr:primosomal protein N' [Candidatus Saccharibacteria bacterium]
MYYEVLPARNGVGEVLTYTFDEALEPGAIVEVPIGRFRAAGVIIKKVAQPIFKCRGITRILYSRPLPAHLVATAQWIADYYQVPATSALNMILPNGVLKKRRKHEAHTCSKLQPNIARDIQLNPHQKMALTGILRALGATKLLFGVTGSGKTNIYLKLAEKALSEQKSVILLVPEIALTGQLVQVFGEVFGDKITLIHSGQTEAERHLIFEKLLNSDEPQVVVGPRSALFAPLSNLGLIIIDEEHESTYYQENSPKYSAIRVASFMAKEIHGDCILGSATPNISDYYIAKKQGSLISLKEKAKSEAIKPKIQIIDFKDRANFNKNRYFSGALLSLMETNLGHGRQTLIFHNRRGSSPLTICEKCGNELLCPTCFLPLTLHADSYTLQCHTCGYSCRVPAGCPECGCPDLIHKGFGTKLLESELTRLFPKARVKRFDADNKKGEGMDSMYSEVRNGDVDILVGTQTLAKGLDLPKLATVGVVAADAGLSLPDFAAEERVFQLLTQVIGRVGRGHLEEANVVIQTYRPEHPVLRYAIDEDFDGFAEYLLKQRRRSGFPPFKYVMRLDLTLKTEATVLRKIQETVQRLGRDKRLIISPPMPAFHERTSQGYTWEIIVRSASRKALIEACRTLDQGFRVSLEPPSLL